MLRPLHFFSLRGENTRLDLLLLNSSHAVLDLAVDLSVKFTALSQLLKHLMLVGALRSLESHVALTLL